LATASTGSTGSNWGRSSGEVSVLAIIAGTFTVGSTNTTASKGTGVSAETTSKGITCFAGTAYGVVSRAGSTVSGATSAGTSGGTTNIVSFFANSTSGGIITCGAVRTASSACGTSRGNEIACLAFSACASSSSAFSTVGDSAFGTDTGDLTVSFLASGASSTGVVTDSTVLSGVGIVVSASLVSNSRSEEDSADEGNEKFVHF